MEIANVMELKKNKMPFMFIEKGLRSEARRIGKEHFYFLDEITSEEDGKWVKCDKGDFNSTVVYRLGLSYYDPIPAGSCGKVNIKFNNYEGCLAEMAVVGCMILDNDCIPLVLHLCPVPIFGRKENKLVYDAVVHIWHVRKAIYDKYPEIDLVAVRDELVERGHLDEVGGTEYLMKIAEAVPTSAHIREYIYASKINKAKN